jgi:hypothetical protein
MLSVISRWLGEVHVEFRTQAGPDRNERMAKWGEEVNHISFYNLIRGRGACVFKYLKLQGRAVEKDSGIVIPIPR